MTEPIYIFWGLVALLALAAVFNHGWHHGRDRHPSTRSTRATHHDPSSPVTVSESNGRRSGTDR